MVVGGTVPGGGGGRVGGVPVGGGAGAGVGAVLGGGHVGMAPPGVIGRPARPASSSFALRQAPVRV